MGATTANTPATARGTLHHRLAREGGRTGESSARMLSDCVSITEVTTTAGWVAGLAIVALIATGWRKPARATADLARARRPLRAPGVLEVIDRQGQPYRAPRWYRRVWAAVASSVLAVWIGAVVATLVGFGLAFAVIELSEMLRR